MKKRDAESGTTGGAECGGAESAGGRVPGMESGEVPRLESQAIVRLDEFSKHVRDENYDVLYRAELVSQRQDFWR